MFWFEDEDDYGSDDKDKQQADALSSTGTPLVSAGANMDQKHVRANAYETNMG